MYIPSFSSPIGTGNLNAIFAYFNDCDALVIDIRNNGGGMLSNVETLVSRFIDSEFTPAYIRHKTGPGHNDFSEPYPMTYHPAGTGKHWDKPVAVLTNRSCFSAANDFVSAMKQLPGVKIVGARTGGGGGMPFSSQMPCGWKVRFSACPVTDASGHDIEEGIDPSPGCEMHAPDAELAAGRDSILEFAISILLGL
jgi:C-terminal processing protease CtpA/Prc